MASEAWFSARRTAAWAVCAAALLGAAAGPAAGKVPAEVREKLTEHKTRYYLIVTDLDEQTVREAAARLTSMVEEYQKRTKGFSRRLTRRMPFYLFARKEDYHASGGVAGSGGQYTGEELMALASRGTSRLWHVIQHEGFHQFSHQVIPGRLAIWAEEGLAEYFGEGLWTGDGLVTGVIPPSRLPRIRALIRGKKLAPFLSLMKMSRKDWSGSLQRTNYDQAWSMVHFLVHGEDGRYRKAFVGFINDTAVGVPSERAFVRRFGGNTTAFTERYRVWWLSLPPDATAEKYTVATVHTLTSFLARAIAERQTFPTGEEFLAAARGGGLKAKQEHWLPEHLLGSALAAAKRLGTWSLDRRRVRVRLVLTRPDGRKYFGAFAAGAGGSIRTQVTVDKPAAPAGGLRGMVYEVPPERSPGAWPAAPAAPGPAARNIQA